MSCSGIYSSHIFMFPFRFDWNEQGFENEFAFYKENPIDSRVNLAKIKKTLQEHDWEYKPFNLKNEPELYNEYAYFYDYARDAIYNQDNSEDPISYYFEREDDLTNALYMIHVKKEKKCYTYNLNIVGLSLRVFHTGVAILSIELENRQTSNFDDILRINDYGRRIYPQFISENSTFATKDAFLANYISIKTSNIDLTENFNFEPAEDIVIGSHIMKILGDSFSHDKKESEKYYIQPILDDRMFVVSWYGDDKLSYKLKSNYKDSNEWYKYIFVDNGDATVKNNQMKNSLIKEATYDRWSGDGTLYGITRYSFVCLTNRSWFPINIVKPHMNTMYFQMVTLLLANRASILRFSDEIAAVASSQEIDRLQPLYERYLTFYNRLYFKEVTHQDQGIELYDIARKHMRIDEHIEKLDTKFTKLFDFANLQSTKREEEEKEKIQNFFNLISGIFIFPSLMIALLSMSIYDYDTSLRSLIVGLIAIVASGFLGYFAFKQLNPIKKSRKKR